MSIQQTIIKGIREQLFSNSYLVLPDFGGFVLKSKPAHFLAAGGSIAPPSKTVSFNAQLRQNDGVLALWLQNALGCDAGEAIRHLKEFSSFCNGILTSRRRISLETIGFFYLDFENNICFEPQADSNFMTESFGLAPVNLKPLPVAPKEPKRESTFIDRVQAEPKTESPAPERKKRKSYSRLLTPALLSILLVSFLAVLLSNRKITGQLKSTFVGTSVQIKYQPLKYAALQLVNTTESNKVYVADANGIALIHLNDNNSLSVSVNGHSTYSNNSQNYELVLGCFSIEQNANKLIKRLAKDRVRAKISGKNDKGLFVVSKGAYSSHEQAVAELANLRSRYPNAWIRQNQ